MKQALTVAWKDLRSELRTKDSLNAAFSFAIVIILVFSFAISIDPEEIAAISGGLLWMVFTFSGTLILNRSFARELPNDCLDVLVASPLSGGALFFGKAMANFVLLLILEAVCFPLFGVLYNVTWTKQPGLLLLVCLLTTWGISAVGTMFSALTVNLNLRELMLPMLIYPALIPLLMASMEVTTVLITEGALSNEHWFWIRVMTAFDIIFTSLALMFVDVVLVG